MKILIDETGIDELIKKIVSGISVELPLLYNPSIIGIKNRGVFIAQRILKKLERENGIKLPYGTLDISLYRDDMSEISDFPILNGSDISFSLKGKDVILVDDILNSGRTALAALRSIMDSARPNSVRLVTLLFNENGREFPIVPDFYGANISLAMEEMILIKLKEYDSIDQICVTKMEVNPK